MTKTIKRVYKCIGKMDYVMSDSNGSLYVSVCYSQERWIVRNRLWIMKKGINEKTTVQTIL